MAFRRVTYCFSAAILLLLSSNDQQLSVRVVYPPSGALIAASDSNFIFGSVSSASARLSIDGVTVKVHPSGAFLAWLPLPSRGTAGYSIVAIAGRDTLRITHPVRLPPPRPVLSTTGALVIDSASLSPRQPVMLREDEMVRVSVRAPSNVTAFVTLGTVRRNLVNGASLPALAPGSSPLDSGAARNYAGDNTRWSALIPARMFNRGARLSVVRGRDSVSLPLPAVNTVDSASPAFGILGVNTPAPSDTDRVVIARPSPGGTYKWMLLPGTMVEVTGRDGDFARIKLDTQLEVWIPAADVHVMPPGFAPPRPAPANSRLESSAEWMDLVIPMGERAPYLVETFNDRVELTLYGVRANLDNISHPALDSLVRSVTAVQDASDRARIVLRTTRPVFGYLVLWQRGEMVLRIRRPPRVNTGSPLRGIHVAVDAGHPPAGATGPTGLYEATATLQIARRLKTILESRGARVFMTRTTDDPLELALRPAMARRANTHVFVSIHLNALPDGINPFLSHGTSTYYFQQHSQSLAREVQSQMLRRLRLRDLGVMYNTFAVTRTTWMPSVLCEGAFIMIPEQEAAIKTSEFQTAYATAVADGLQRYFASIATTVVR